MSVTKPFERRPAETGLRRLAGNRRACIREIEDLLAQAASVRDVTPEQVACIATQQGVALQTRLGTADVEHLRRLLVLSDTDAADVHDQVLADHRLDPEEAEFLRRLGGALAIPDAARDHRYGEAERRARRRGPPGWSGAGRQVIGASSYLNTLTK